MYDEFRLRNHGFKPIFLVINFLIYLDIYLMLRNPFYPKRKRSKYYYIILSIVSLANLIPLIDILFENDTTDKINDFNSYIDVSFIVNLRATAFLLIIMILSI